MSPPMQSGGYEIVQLPGRRRRYARLLGWLRLCAVALAALALFWFARGGGPL